MYKIEIENMDLEQIATSGQFFRWKKIDENRYSVVAFGKRLEICQDGIEFSMSCDEQEWNEIWSSYFDLDTDYANVARLINESEDEHLKEAYSKGSGVRILRQDLWEIIVSFIISQNNNISRITQSIDKICTRCELPALGGEYRFPYPGEVEPEFWDDSTLGLGYRNEYLKLIYEYAKENPKWLDELKTMSYDDAMQSLMERKGIGKKVANCICLFGLHHVDAFPIDTHVKQLLAKYYQNGFDFDRYKGVAGIVQQYLFYYEIS